MIYLVFIVTFLISLLAVARVKSTYHKYSRISAHSGYSGAETAYRILQTAGIDDVEIVSHNGFLGDHYDPLHKRLVLSTENYYGTSAAALGVAAHECGHAIQHKIAYAPLQIRMAAIGITTFANQIVTFLPFLGIGTGLLSVYTGLLIIAIAWGIIMLFNLITLPVEFDASRRAKIILLQTGLIQKGTESMAVHKVLNAAALTYVAGFITSLAYFLIYLLPLITGHRRD